MYKVDNDLRRRPYTVSFAYDKADGAMIVQRGSVVLTNAANLGRSRVRAVEGVRKHDMEGGQRRRERGSVGSTAAAVANYTAAQWIHGFYRHCVASSVL